MLRRAASFVVAAYHKYASLLADLRSLSANFLQSRPKFDFLREHLFYWGIISMKPCSSRYNGFSIGKVWHYLRIHCILIIGFTACCAFDISDVSAQQPGFDPTGRSGDAPTLPAPLPPESPPEFVLPSQPTQPEKEKHEDIQGPRIWLKAVHLKGNTVFSEKDLASEISPYLNRQISSDDLESLRRDITLFYVQHGYITSGAVIPDQSVSDGVITLRIIEGELSEIHIEGLQRLNRRYIKDRLMLDAGPPLNIVNLQQRLQLLQQDPLIQRLNAELKPGIDRGQSDLDVRVEEATPYRVWVRFNNYQSPSVGAEREELSFIHRDVSGNGDTFAFTLGRSEGAAPKLDVSYALPLNASDTSIAFQFRKNVFNSIERQFSALDIKSRSDIYTITLRQPLYHSVHQEFAVFLSAERLNSETFLLGYPFSFSPGADNGRSTVTAMRLGQEWNFRTLTQAFSALSRFSFGLDALDSTIHDDSAAPDSRFFDWLGQFQWLRRLPFWNTQSIFRTDVQLSNRPLLALEQISVGGRYSVRGYRENQMVRDNGVISSLEFRIPILQEKTWADVVQLAPFIDYGHAWNTRQATPDLQDLSSAGLGLRWELTSPSHMNLHPQFEIYWGIPFRHIDYHDWNLQDSGVHFQLSISAF